MRSPADSPIRVSTPLDGAATGGRVALLEVELAAGAEVPAHAVGRAELVVFVAAGAVELRHGDEWSRLGPGEARAIERGAPRALRAAEAARLICLLVPAGSEGLAVELAAGELDGDDGAALLTAAGVEVLPRLGSAAGIRKPAR